MKKKYIKPELVNIITVGGGKAEHGVERSSRIFNHATKMHVTTKIVATNIAHKTNTNEYHFKLSASASVIIAANFSTLHLTNTPTSKQIGPS